MPGPGEVLIRVHAAGLNRPDILQRQGKYPPPPGITDIPGLEIAGEIIDSHAGGYKEGDLVCALLAGGGYAEYAVAPAGQCLPVPKNLSMIEAAALPETVFTVWNNLIVRGQMKPGETIMIQGGASGIGTMAIQIARALGAGKIIITAGSDEKCAACKNLGADIAINYKSADIEKVVAADSVNVILDMTGGPNVAKHIKFLAPEGRHVSIAYLTGQKSELDLNAVMQKRLILTGSTLRSRPVTEKEHLARDIQETIWPLIGAGQIRPVIFKTFPLDRASEAQAALENGDHIGKIVLKVV